MDKIKEYISQTGNEFKIHETSDLRLLIGGSVNDDIHMIRQGFLLLNNETINIGQ